MKRELGSLAGHRAFLGLPPKKGAVAPFPCSPAKVFAVQVAGLVRRLRAIRCRDVVIGVSGGLDSALALLVCSEAFARLRLDPKRIHAITMPGFGTTRRTRGNALALAEGLGVATETIPIGGIVRRHLKEIGHDGTTPDAAYENAQARMRTMVLMDRANMVGGMAEMGLATLISVWMKNRAYVSSTFWLRVPAMISKAPPRLNQARRGLDLPLTRTPPTGGREQPAALFKNHERMPSSRRCAKQP